MKVLKSRFLRVFLIMTLILSFFVSSAFASTVVLPYSEPPVSDSSGYCVVEYDNQYYFTYWWNVVDFSTSSSSNDHSANATCDITVGTSSVTFRFYALPTSVNSGFSYNLQYTNGSSIYLLGSTTSYNAISKSDGWNGHTITGIYYGGNVGQVSGFSNVNNLNISWGSTNFYSKVDSIISALGTINREVELSAYRLNLLYDIFKSYPDDIADIIDFLLSINTDTSTIIDILEEWADTTLDESTSPLPNQGLNDFESSQGSLRGDSDVSSSLDDVFNDVDFGSFSNGFSAVWGLVDGVLNSHPIFFTLVILVLSLGLLNLIFNRR